LDNCDLVFFKKPTRCLNGGNARLPAGLTEPLPPPSGAVTFEFRKNPGEMALVNEAAYESNVRQPQPVSEQQLPSPLDSFSNQPLVRRCARRLAESA
jgi:hypothetical protein